MARRPSRAKQIIEKVFFERYESGATEVNFLRSDLHDVCQKYGIEPLANMGDGAVYAFRYRTPLPDKILNTEPKGQEWIIEGTGIGSYRFKLVKKTRIIPRNDLITIKIPDATPEIISAYALDDEQALLAVVRYNRLIDTFLGLTTYSLQNHLRTTVTGIGQIEIDELYIGLDRHGCHYIIPVQAKGGNDQIGIVQTTQDIRFAGQRFPGMRCRAIAAQFMDEDVVALFELILQDDDIKVVDEKHYRLVPSSSLDSAAIRSYRD